MDNLERIRLSRKQRRLSRKWSLETDDNIESNQLENETKNDIYELKDNSEDQLEISEENSWKNEKEIKQFRQSMPERRKKRVLKRDKTLKVTTSDITKINEIKKVKEKEVLSSTSSNARLSTNRLHHKSRKRIHDPSSNIEIPITEILRKYEEPVPPTPLTTDKIYIQGDNGFSMVKIITKEDDRRNVLKFLSKGRLSKQIYSSISIAIIAQKLFKRTAFVYQGLLGGMALVHLTMMQFFFDSTMNFISKYSHFSEIYYSLFSLLIVLSVISTFDKFDLARLDVDQLKDICKDYVVSAIAIPLYLTTLCLHETFANVDDKLTLIHYQYFNNTSWNDTMYMEELFDELTTWKKVNISKDLLVILGWFFVAIGIREDTLLIHLESMQGSAETTYIK